jgi:hypothetical protein
MKIDKIMEDVYELNALKNTQLQNLKRLKRIKLEVDLLLESYESTLQLMQAQFDNLKKTIKED